MRRSQEELRFHFNLMTSNKLGQIVWTGCMKDKWRYPAESGRRDIKVNDISVNKVT